MRGTRRGLSITFIVLLLMGAMAFGQNYDGLLKPPKQLFTGPQSHTEAVAVGDVNGDGFNDIVAVNTFYFDPEWDYKTIVFLQDTSTTPHGFHPPVTYNGLYPKDVDPTVLIADVNGDTLKDVVLETNNGFGVYYQDGLGGLLPMQHFAPTYSKSFGHGGIAVGDFNNDTRKDVVIDSHSGPNSYLEVFLQDNSGDFTTSATYVHSIYADHISVGRLNGDNLDDIVITGDNKIAVFLQNAGGTLDAEVTYDTGDFENWLDVGDVNNDGRDDVVVNLYFGADDNLAIFYQNAGGTLTVPPSFFGTLWNDWAVKVADVNRDGNNDIILQGGGITVLYQTTGGGMESDYVTYPTLGSQHPHSFDFGDINGDGRGDVVFGQDANNGVTINYGWTGIDTLVLSYPNGGEKYNIGSNIWIRYQKFDNTGNISEVDLSYSINGGASWQLIEAGLDQWSFNDSSTFFWTAPLTPSDNCLIRVNGGGFSDQSYYAFTLVDDGVERLNLLAPANGDTLVAGTSFPISWEHSGDIENVRIEYSIDNGSNWTTIAASQPIDVTYLWTVPNTPSTQCKMRISDALDNSPTDTGDGVFTILAPGSESLRVTSPNGGESLTGGSSHTITWTSTGTIPTVVLEFSSNNGGSWSEIAITSNTGSYSWTVPSINSSQCLVRVSNLAGGTPADQSNSVFSISTFGSTATITVQSPNGGEFYCIGRTQEIKWVSTATAGNVKIQYSVNNGGSWITIVSSTANDGSYSWTVPDTASGQCLVKISDAADGDPTDTGNAVFTIGECGATLSLTSPKGSETWQVGSVHNITWVSGDKVGSQVKLQYSTNNQATWNTLVSATPNDGSYAWTIPNAPSTTCNVKISDTANAGISNISYGKFSIVTGKADPEISLNRTALYFGSLRSSTAKTGIQGISVTNSGSGTLKWNAAIDDPDPDDGDDLNWLKISNTTGTQSGKVEVYVMPSQLAAGTYTGAIRFTSTNASNSPQAVNVTLNVYPTMGDSPPFGAYETPVHGSTVMSSIAVTGWALDDIGIDNVTIWREEGGSRSYIGEALLVEGARPDVEQAYPTTPMSYQAGWGYMLLTNMLPNGGNGTFTLSAYAKDLAGHEVKLGSKTITCDNAHAVKPFGAMDAPIPGGETSGSSFKNQGWVLTPMPNKIPENGSTIKVYVDGQNLGNPTYNAYRADIAALFPGYANSSGAFAYYNLDTTAFENGVHTMQWIATDNAGNTDGIGSRYFTIRNSGYNRQTGTTQSRENTDANTGSRCRPSDLLTIPAGRSTAVKVTAGYKEGNKPQRMKAGQDGIIHITLPQDERLVLDLNRPQALRHTGYLAFKDQLRPLPPGASLDNRSGIFYWQPGPASLGKYPLVFVSEAETGSTKIIVTVEIIPKFAD